MNSTIHPRLLEQNLYEILEVEPGASQQDIHRAYQRVRATYSQDSPALYSMFSREEAGELLKLIEEAYSVLGNPTLRDVYDQKIRGGRVQTFTLNQTIANMPTAPLDGSFAIPEADIIPESPQIPLDVPRVTSEGYTPSFTPEFKATPVPTVNVPAASAEPAEGMGRTKYSVYNLDQSFEKEIKSMQNFDGPTLQKIRLYKNISLDKICDVTKVSSRYVTAIETNDVSSLPAPVFVRGFIVQIAKALELDEKLAANSYMDMLKKALDGSKK